MKSDDIKTTAKSLYLEEVKGTELDDFLSMGWYRMGPTIFTNFFICYESTLFSTIWLRTTLKDYSYSKSLRKLARKNKTLLIHNFEPYEYSDELEELYLQYKRTFKGDLPDTLDTYMLNSLESGIFDTWLVKVYEKDKLIACSIFDVGEKTLASIFGFYDPSFSDMSLGLFTMLLEIEFAKQREMDLYYIGYFVPGNPRFDYKLRLGNIQYLDFRTREWIAFDKFDYEQTPIKVIRRKLQSLSSKLDKTYDLDLYKNAFIDAHIIQLFTMHYVEDPMIIIINGLAGFQDEETVLLCTYDVALESYKLQHCKILDAVFSSYSASWLQSLNDNTLKHQLVIIKTLKTCKRVSTIERWLDNLDSARLPKGMNC